MTTQPNTAPSFTQEDRIEEMQFIINQLRLTVETRAWLVVRPSQARLR